MFSKLTTFCSGQMTQFGVRLKTELPALQNRADMIVNEVSK